jgi:hypothetical protein
MRALQMGHPLILSYVLWLFEIVIKIACVHIYEKTTLQRQTKMRDTEDGFSRLLFVEWDARCHR